MAPCLQTRNQSVVVEWSNKIVDVGAIITLQFYNNCTLFFFVCKLVDTCVTFNVPNLAVS